MLTKKTLTIITIVIICLTFMIMSGIFYHLDQHYKDKPYSFMYWPLAIGFGSFSGSVLMNLIFKNILPTDIRNEMINISDNSI